MIPGFLLWVTYGLVKGDLFLALPNALACVVGVGLIAVALTATLGEERFVKRKP